MNVTLYIVTYQAIYRDNTRGCVASAIIRMNLFPSRWREGGDSLLRTHKAAASNIRPEAINNWRERVKPLFSTVYQRQHKLTISTCIGNRCVARIALFWLWIWLGNVFARASLDLWRAVRPCKQPALDASSQLKLTTPTTQLVLPVNGWLLFMITTNTTVYSHIRFNGMYNNYS